VWAGGLPFFGGAGNSYPRHAIAETVRRARQAPGTFGFVGANGGIMSKYSAGEYGRTPTGWTPDRSQDLQSEVAERRACSNLGSELDHGVGEALLRRALPLAGRPADTGIWHRWPCLQS
jgi:hypothetical protein